MQVQANAEFSPEDDFEIKTEQEGAQRMNIPPEIF
jgi:hypothetical protein